MTRTREEALRAGVVENKEAGVASPTPAVSPAGGKRPVLFEPGYNDQILLEDGRLLQVSPWEYHMQRRTISREQCLMLNRLVETITFSKNRFHFHC